MAFRVQHHLRDRLPGRGQTGPASSLTGRLERLHMFFNRRRPYDAIVADVLPGADSWAMLRRGTQGREPVLLSHGPVRADAAARRVWNGAAEVVLPPTQFDLLSLFLRSPGEVLTRGRILSEVWHCAYDAHSNVVDHHVALLRRRMQEAGDWPDLETVRGVGYRLRPAA